MFKWIFALCIALLVSFPSVSVGQQQYRQPTAAEYQRAALYKAKIARSVGLTSNHSWDQIRLAFIAHALDVACTGLRQGGLPQYQPCDWLVVHSIQLLARDSQVKAQATIAEMANAAAQKILAEKRKLVAICPGQDLASPWEPLLVCALEHETMARRRALKLPPGASTEMIESLWAVEKGSDVTLTR